MPIAIIMPKFEMAQETGTVGRWLKYEGEAVSEGETILEVDTDKVSMEVQARADGTLVGICAKPGEVVPIGQTIAYILEPGETWSPETAAAPHPESVPAQATTAPVRATPLAERLAADNGIDLGSVVGTGTGGRITREDVEALLGAAVPQATPVTSEIEGKVRAVPASRRLARELDVDLRTVQGTGPDGRIQTEDVARAAASAKAVVAVPPPPKPIAAQPVVSIQGRPAVRRIVPLSNIRRTIAERMLQSVREAPQFTVGVDVDMGRAMAVVQDFRTAPNAQSTPKVTVTALLVKACAWALAGYPAANSIFENDQLVEWDEVNVGVATAVDQGLIVPVVRGADRLGMKNIAGQLADLTGRAREGRLRLEDLQGGTFTLSNLGMFGTDRFTAILNPPQAAILAVGRVAKRAVVGEDDRIEVRQMTSLALTADHRVLDGAAAAQFLALIQQALEHPGLLLG